MPSDSQTIQAQTYTFFLFYRLNNHSEPRSVGDYQVEVSGSDETGFKAVVNNVSEQMSVRVYECESANYDDVECEVIAHLDAQHPQEGRTEYRPDGPRT